MQETTSQGVLQYKSELSFNDTISALKEKLNAMEFTIIAEIDHSAAAEKVNMTLLPTRLIIFGKPVGGTPLIQEASSFALDLPLKLLINEDINGDVFVSFNDPVYLAQRHGVDVDNSAILMMKNAIAKIAQ